MNFKEFVPRWKAPNFGKVNQLQKMVGKNPDNLLYPRALTSLSDWLTVQRIAPRPKKSGRLINLTELAPMGARQLALSPPIPRDEFGQPTGKAIVRRLAVLNPGVGMYGNTAAGMFNMDTRDMMLGPAYADMHDPRIFFHEYGHGEDAAEMFSREDKEGLLKVLDHLGSPASSTIPKNSIANVLHHISSPYYTDPSTSAYLKTLPDVSPAILKKIREQEAVAELVAQQKLNELWEGPSNSFKKRMPFGDNYLPNFDSSYEWFA